MSAIAVRRLSLLTEPVSGTLAHPEGSIMSLHTWMKEFYPYSANDRRALKNPILHSLRKWTGLTAANLARHKIKRPYGRDRKSVV